jgi:hypothetical protein
MEAEEQQQTDRWARVPRYVPPERPAGAEGKSDGSPFDPAVRREALCDAQRRLWSQKYNANYLEEKMARYEQALDRVVVRAQRQLDWLIDDFATKRAGVEAQRGRSVSVGMRQTEECGSATPLEQTFLDNAWRLFLRGLAERNYVVREFTSREQDHASDSMHALCTFRWVEVRL